MELLVIRPRADDARDDERLSAVLRDALSGTAYRECDDMAALPDLRGRRLLFAAALGDYGVNAAYGRLLRRLRAEPGLLEGCAAGLVIDGSGELYTKSTAAELVLAVNGAGCALLGRPLVEATG